MFQTNLPSGRRRLFVLLLIIFAITVFGMRYVLVSLGWVGEPSTPPAQQTSSNQPQTKLETSTPQISKAEIAQAKNTAISFIKRYTQRDLAASDRWFQSIQADLTPVFADDIKREVELSRPTVLVQKTNFAELKRSTCEPVSGNVYCTLEVTTEEINQQQQVTRVDKVYEVILTGSKENWKVEGLNIHGSLD